MTNKNKHYTVKSVQYCTDCNNFDCPNATTKPYWRRCPATPRLSNLEGVAENHINAGDRE